MFVLNTLHSCERSCERSPSPQRQNIGSTAEALQAEAVASPTAMRPPLRVVLAGSTAQLRKGARRNG